MNLVSVECPSCGARLPPREPTGHYRCDYCSAEFKPEQAKHAQDQAGQAISTQQLAQAIVQAQQQLHAQQQAANRKAHPELYASQPAAVKPIRGVLMVAGLAIAAAGVVPVVMWNVAASDPGNGGGGIATVGGGGIASERLLWDDNGGPPAAVKIDGQPAFLGRTRAVTNDDQLYIDAYDMSGERKWRVDGLGSYGDSYQNVRFGAEGDTVVISTPEAKLRFVDVATGETKSEVALSDQVKRICTKADAADEIKVPEEPVVWVSLIDKNAYLVDVTTGELTEQSKPIWCDPSDWPSGRNHEERHPANSALKIDGLEIQRSYVDGDIAVAAAVKSPGTQIPHAIGYDPKTLDVLWDEVISKVPAASNRRNSTDFSALAGGKYFAMYGEGQDIWHLAAFDASRGTSLWDKKLRGILAVDSINRLEATADHVFVVRTSSLEVWDADAGELLVTIGAENYD